MATYGSLRRACARFDTFQVDLSSSELFRSGVRVPIQDQPLQILRLLLQAEGKVVTREQVRQTLWPQDTFVDFEHGVNTAVKKLRQALEDSAESPKFVETLPKIGYRFIAPVEWVPEANNHSPLRRVVPIAPPGPTAVAPLAPDPELPRPARSRWPLPLLAIGLLFLVAIGGYLLRPRRQIQPDQLTITPFTTFPGFEIEPSFSPDGNQIVFAWFGYEHEFQFDLYIKQVGQEHVVQLTRHPATFLSAAWSPDSRFIAFMRYIDGDADASGVYVISALGGSERKLTGISQLVSFEPIGVTWSADGKWLAFAKGRSSSTQADSSPEHFHIHLVNVETTEERVLPDPSPDCVNMWHVAFSPDGKLLASVCVLTGDVAQIYVQSPDGKQARALAGARSLEGFVGLAWAADNQSLLYSAERSLWRMPLTGRKPDKLLFAQDVESVAVARTGNRLAYAQVRHPGSIWQLALDSQVKPLVPVKLISSSRGDVNPHISPDGKHVAFQSWRSGSQEVWISDRDSSNPVQLSSFGGPEIGWTTWSPDSRRIAFDLRASGTAELFIVNVDGGPPKQFPTGTPNASSPFWSADGHWIYFNTERPNAIWKAPVDGGSPVRLTPDGEGRTWPQEAVELNRIFYSKGDGSHGQTWSASADGGDERPVSKMPPDAFGALARNGVYFISGSPRHFTLDFFDFTNQHVRTITALPGLFVSWGPNLSSDGHTLFFTGIEHSEGDLILVEGFH